MRSAPVCVRRISAASRALLEIFAIPYILREQSCAEVLPVILDCPSGRPIMRRGAAIIREMPEIDPNARTQSPRLITRRQFIVGGVAVAGSVAAYSYGPARHRIGVVEHDVYIHDLPGVFDGFTIAQMSDFHFGPIDEAPIVDHAVAIVNDLKPGLTVLTGDFVTADHHNAQNNIDAANRAAISLSRLQMPRFASEGNHDTINLLAVRNALASRGTPMLYNSHVELRKGGAKVWLCGIADICLDRPDLDRALPPAAENEPAILLGHAPDYVDTVTKFAKEHGRRCDLMLAGHTHGGQINVPGLVRTMLPEWGRKYKQGSFQVDSTLLYVNRGLGTIHLPMRWNAPPEITVFRLRRITG